MKTIYKSNMEITINLKKRKKLEFIVELLQSFDYVEIIDLEKEETQLPKEHRDLLDERLKRIEDGKVSFKSWENIKGKYEKVI